MRRKLLLALALATLVATAGCSSILGDNTPTTAPEPNGTLNDTDSPPSTTPDANLSSGLNTSAIIDSHEAGLRAAGSYTLKFGQMTKVANESVTKKNKREIHRDHQVNLAANEEYANITVLSGGTGPDNTGAMQTTREYYISNGTVYLKQYAFGKTNYATQEGEVAMNMTSQTNILPIFLDNLAFEKAEEKTINGTHAVRYEATEVTNQTGLTQMENGTFTDAWATVVIDENGIVRNFAFEGTLDSPQQKQPVYVRLSMAFTDVGETSVEEPNWTDKAANNSSSEPTTTPGSDGS